jgi:alkyl sulfatase BDS1-like metallo-beta-lactamase superfamily hydrolase
MGGRAAQSATPASRQETSSGVNATLTNLKGFLAEKPDLTLTIHRSDLEQTMMGATTLEAQIADGTAKVKGGKPAKADPYEAVPRQSIAE